MDTANFYLACSGVLPILTLAYVIEDAGVRNADAISLPRVRSVLASVGEPQTRSGFIRGAKIGRPLLTLLLGAFCAWAEVDCLRALETGHVPYGAPANVWVALGLLFALLIIDRLMGFLLTDYDAIIRVLQPPGESG